MIRSLTLLAALLISSALFAEDIRVPAGSGNLATAIAGAKPGDVLLLESGRYEGAIVIDRPLSITGPSDAIIDGLGQGTVVTIDASDVTIKGVTVTGSGLDSTGLDAGIKILRKADRAQIDGNRVLGNLHGIDDKLCGRRIGCAFLNKVGIQFYLCKGPCAQQLET